MPLHFVPLVWCRIKTSRHVGRILHLIPIRALLAFCSMPCLCVTCLVFHLCVLGRLLFCCLAQPMQTPLCGGKQLTMEAIDTCSTSIRTSLLTTPDSDEYDEHNMWNHMLKLFRQEHVVTAMESYLMKPCWGEPRSPVASHSPLQCDKAELHYRPMLRLNSKASSFFFFFFFFEYPVRPSAVTVTNQAIFWIRCWDEVLLLIVFMGAFLCLFSILCKCSQLHTRVSHDHDHDHDFRTRTRLSHYNKFPTNT